MINLTQAEIEERTAILKRFRSLLEQQRAKFKEYLRVLEEQEKTIQTENTDALMIHTELEQQIVSNIISLQKVIKPIETMYNEAFSDGNANLEIPHLKADLQNLQAQVLERNKKNRELLQVHIGQIKERLSSYLDYRDGIVYTQLLYDPKECAQYVAEQKDLLYKIQIGIDKANMITEIEI